MKRTAVLLKEPWLWLAVAVGAAILAREADETLQTYLMAIAAAAGIAAAGVITTRIFDRVESLRAEDVRGELRRTQEERDSLTGQHRRAMERVLELEADVRALRVEADKLTEVVEILPPEEAEVLRERGVSRIYANRERAGVRIAQLVMEQADRKLGEIQVVAVAGRELLHWGKGVKYEDIPLVEALRNRLIEPGNNTKLWYGLLRPEKCDEATRRDFFEGNNETIQEIIMSRNNLLGKFDTLVASGRASLDFYTKRPSMFVVHTPHAAIVQHYAEAPRCLPDPPNPDHPWAEGCCGDVDLVVESRPGTFLYDTLTEEIRCIRQYDCEPASEMGSVDEKPLPPWKTPARHQ